VGASRAAKPPVSISHHPSVPPFAWGWAPLRPRLYQRAFASLHPWLAQAPNLEVGVGVQDTCLTPPPKSAFLQATLHTLLSVVRAAAGQLVAAPKPLSRGEQLGRLHLPQVR
jgi:hypothetical protein